MDIGCLSPEAVEGMQRSMTAVRSQGTHSTDKCKDEDEMQRLNILYEEEVLVLRRARMAIEQEAMEQQAETEQRLVRIQLVKQQRLADAKLRIQEVEVWTSELKECQTIETREYGYTDLVLVSTLCFDMCRARPQLF